MQICGGFSFIASIEDDDRGARVGWGWATERDKVDGAADGRQRDLYGASELKNRLNLFLPLLLLLLLLLMLLLLTFWVVWLAALVFRANMAAEAAALDVEGTAAPSNGAGPKGRMIWIGKGCFRDRDWDREREWTDIVVVPEFGFLNIMELTIAFVSDTDESSPPGEEESEESDISLTFISNASLLNYVNVYLSICSEANQTETEL